MKTAYKLALALFLFTAALVVAPFASAQSPFDGTWHVDKTQITGSMVILLQHGIFDCKNMPLFDPEIRVKADGADQPVSGHPFDAMSVSQASPNSFKWTMKKGGNIVREDDETLSADGNTLTGKGIIYRPNNTNIESDTTFKRLAPAPAGADKVSGTWQTTVTQTGTDLVVFTFKSNSDGLDFSNSAGASWSAKFDGKDNPDKGVPGNVTLSLKRISDRSFEEAVKHDGTTAYLQTWTVSNDGTTLTLVSKDPKLGSTTTYFAHKQ